jgi:hypothetical protein
METENAVTVREQASASIGALAAALAKAQGAMNGAKKDAKNPFFKSQYADLASVWDACRAPLSANGLAVIQTTGGQAGAVEVITTLAHTSGEWIRGVLALHPVKADPQGIGSAITYARRYALAAIVGIAPEDDDGNAASGKTAEATRGPLPPDVATPVPPAKPSNTTKATPAPKATVYEPDPGAMQSVTVTLGKVERQHGEGRKGRWTRTYSKADDGKFYSTFDTKIGQMLEELAGKTAILGYAVKQTPKGTSNEILDVRPVIERDPAEPTAEEQAAMDKADTERKQQKEDNLPF